MKEISSKSFKLMPWKNGRGITQEIYREDLSDDMSFRLSKATISENGPFSVFPGYDRYLIILSGKGCELRFENSEFILNEEAVCCFRGEENIIAKLIDGPVIDFNVFFKRSIYDCKVRWIEKEIVHLNENSFIYLPDEEKLLVFENKEIFEVAEKAILIELKKAP